METKVIKDPKFNVYDIESFDGAFLFVNANNTSELLTDGTERGNVEIKVGESISVPIVFEYFLSQKQQITKRLMFDIKKSLIETPLNYILELTANYDSSLEANIDNVNTTVISDEATQSTNSVSISWSKVTGATAYKIYQYDYSKKQYYYVGKTKDTKFTIKNLKAGTIYKFRVRAYKNVDGTQYFALFTTKELQKSLF